MDDGNYVCKAQNPYGTDETFTKINVLEAPNIDETSNVDPQKYANLGSEKTPKDRDRKKHTVPPKVLIPLSDAVINEGEPILFLARIDGLPKPKV